MNHFKNLHNPILQKSRFDFTVEDFLENFDASRAGQNRNAEKLLNGLITIEEITCALKKLKSGKSPGPDGIPNEFFRNSKASLIPMLLFVFNAIFDAGVFPKEWGKGIIVPLHKKGSFQDPNNFRGITLLDSIGKIFTFILNQRLTKWADMMDKITECQAGFRRGYSTIDNIFVLHVMVQKYLCKSKGRFYCVFIDFSKAFDSVNHNLLLYRLCLEGIGGKMFNILKSMYQEVKSCVKAKQGRTDYFQCTVGVRQGCMLSPFLFSLFINELNVMLENSGNKGIQITQELYDLFSLLYADDVIIFSDTPVGLQRLIRVLESFCTKWKLSVNLNKSQVIVFRRGGILKKGEQWFFNGQKMKIVSYYKYLGLMISSRNVWGKAVSTLADQARKAMSSIFRMIRNTCTLPFKEYFKLFDTMILPVLTYGAEIWGYRMYNVAERVQLKYCKAFMGVKSSTADVCVLGDCGRFPIFIYTYKKVLCYWYKLLKMPRNRVAKHAYELAIILDRNNKESWATHVKNLLCEHGFGEVWYWQGPGDFDIFLFHFMTRAVDIFKQNWYSETCSKNKLRQYCNFKLLFQTEDYLLSNMHHRFKRAIARLRNSGLALEVEEGRMHGIDLEERTCKICNSLEIEDEFHFICVCPLYDNLRQKYLPRWSFSQPTLEKFYLLMSSSNTSDIFKLASFVYKAEKLRKECL